MRKFWESIYSPNYISGYNPFLLKDMNRAIERMVSAINTREKIVLYGIPNVDGLCAISSLILVLTKLENEHLKTSEFIFRYTDQLFEVCNGKKYMYFKNQTSKDW